MHYHSNHVWCSRCNWDDGDYSTRHMISFDKYNDNRNDLNFNEFSIQVDWDNLVTTEKWFDEETFKRNKEFYKDRDTHLSEDDLKELSTSDIPSLKPEVIDWLNSEIPDSTDKARKSNPKAWAMGNSEYRGRDSQLSFTIWFLRRNDALRFIKTFSVHKKPTTYLNYFNNDYRELKKGKLVKVNR